MWRKLAFYNSAFFFKTMLMTPSKMANHRMNFDSFSNTLMESHVLLYLLIRLHVLNSGAQEQKQVT